MPTLRMDMSIGLRGDVVGPDDFDEDFFQIVFGILFAKLGESAFREELAVVDDANGVAELLDFAHNVYGEDDGLAVVAAFADESGDGACRHDVEAKSGFIEDHNGRVVNKSACDGGFLLHASGELVAAAGAKAVYVQAGEEVVVARFGGRCVPSIDAAPTFRQ